jgi:ubiquinone/menaquinone biosynthesis C-methylase UbiE
LIILWAVLAFVAATTAFGLAWRWASRKWSLPCPALLAGSLESPRFQRLNGTQVTLERLGLKPGLRILEIGPGPGRLLIPAAERVAPGGEAVGIDIQLKMIERLKARAAAAGVTNLTAILADATHAQVPAGTFDLAFLSAALGEIPDRAAVLAQCHRALKPGGVLSITELAGDPHYQRRATVRRLAEAAGFRYRSMHGSWLRYTADFVKPA